LFLSLASKKPSKKAKACKIGKFQHDKGNNSNNKREQLQRSLYETELPAVIHHMAYHIEIQYIADSALLMIVAFVVLKFSNFTRFGLFWRLFGG